MKEEHIVSIASILDKWNPLGDSANMIEGLDGYRCEAIDIMSTINISSGKNKIENAIYRVLTQAFSIEIDKSELSKIADDIKDVLSS